VNVPVSLYPATRHHSLDFDMLDKRDMQPVGYQRINKETGKPVPWDEIVKGYEYEKGRFVVLNKEDFQHAALEKSRTVDIRSFVKGEEIDDRFFETSYYLTPAKGGERAYALLREAIRETALVGIATIVLREAQHLAALEVKGDAMVLTLMRYAEELVDTGDFSFPSAKDVRKPELQMARTLVENLADSWDPSQFTDEYRANLMKIIRAKMKGKEAHLQSAEEPRQAEVVDLMERLRQSLQAGGKGSHPARAKKSGKTRKAAVRGKSKRHAA